MVECSPATRAARVRFPADAHLLYLLIIAFSLRFLNNLSICPLPGKVLCLIFFQTIFLDLQPSICSGMD